MNVCALMDPKSVTAGLSNGIFIALAASFVALEVPLRDPLGTLCPSPGSVTTILPSSFR